MMWSMQIERSMAVYSDWGAASALGVVLLVITIGLLWLVSRIVRFGALVGARMMLGRAATTTGITHLHRLWLYGVAGLVILFLVAPTLLVIPMSFSASRFLEFPPPAWSLALVPGLCRLGRMARRHDCVVPPQRSAR